MVTIYLNSENRGLNLQSFSTRMLEICNEHRQQGRALAFAFILYDFDNPQVAKVLNDREYWLALNKVSGKYLTVFSLNYQEPQPNPASIEFLTAVSTTMNPAEGTNALIEKYFGRDVDVSYPAILFFQVAGERVVDSLLVTLAEEEIEQAFLELREYIGRAVEALKRITPTNRRNIKEIFDCLEREVERARKMRTVKRVVGGAEKIFGLVSSIKGLF